MSVNRINCVPSWVLVAAFVATVLCGPGSAQEVFELGDEGFDKVEEPAVGTKRGGYKRYAVR